MGNLGWGLPQMFLLRPTYGSGEWRGNLENALPHSDSVLSIFILLTLATIPQGLVSKLQDSFCLGLSERWENDHTSPASPTLDLFVTPWGRTEQGAVGAPLGFSLLLLPSYKWLKSFSMLLAFWLIGLIGYLDTWRLADFLTGASSGFTTS